MTTRPRSPHGPGAALLAAVLLTAPRALADPPRDPAGAESLFKSAKEALAAGDWASACKKFHASMDLDPAVGTELKIGKCFEHEGKLAQAWYAYKLALKLNAEKADQTPERRAELEDYTKKVIAALEPRVPKLVVSVAGAPPGLRVTRNGQDLPVTTLGEALPVDAGSEEIVATAPGRRTEKRTVAVEPGQVVAVNIQLRPDVSRAGPTPEGIAPRADVASPDAPRASWSRQRKVGVAVGAAGVVTLGVAAGFGIATLAKVSQSSPYCNEKDVCKRPGFDLRQDARSIQNTGFAVAAVGGAILATGVVLFVTTLPRSRRGTTLAEAR